MSEQTRQAAPGKGAEDVAHEAAHLLGDAVRSRTGDFVQAVGEALRAGGDTMARREYGLAADCFDSAAQRLEGFWGEVEGAGDDAPGAAAGAPLRRRLQSNPTLAYGAALAAGFLVGAFLRAGFDDSGDVP